MLCLNLKMNRWVWKSLPTRWLPLCSIYFHLI